jgi:hypothetical protein
VTGARERRAKASDIPKIPAAENSASPVRPIAPPLAPDAAAIRKHNAAMMA